MGIFGCGPNRLQSLLDNISCSDSTNVSSEQASLAYESHSAMQANYSNGLFKSGHTILGMSGFVVINEQRASLNQIYDLYADQGAEGLETLRGAFILAVYDGQQAYLFRDAAGQRTCYFALLDGQLIFAPQPKAIHQLQRFSKNLKVSALSQYLSFSFVPGMNTMLEDLYELPPGHRLSFSNKRYELKRYYKFENQPYSQHSEEQWTQLFKNSFSQAVALRMPKNGPVGVFLSGGLDSSIVTAELVKQSPLPVKSYSLHFGSKYPNELEYAQALAKHVGTEHCQVLIKPKGFLQKLRKIIWTLDDPIGDPITIPNYELAQYASQDVDWVFNGEGGDPCFGGPKNYGMLIAHWYGDHEWHEYFREEAYLRSFKRAYDELDHLLLPHVRVNKERHLYGILNPFFTAEKPAHFLNKLMAMNIRMKGAHLILPKVERMLGANGILSMSPLFDDRLVDLSIQMPPKMKVAYGDEKRILKMAFAQKIPQQIIERPKSGMRVPVHFWFQKEMRRYAKHILSPKELGRAGLFQPERVKQLLNYDVQEHNKRCGLKLWMLMTFEIWRRLVLEGEAL